jgi:cobalt-zinc-cadmium efflux system outer membrane protein
MFTRIPFHYSLTLFVLVFASCSHRAPEKPPPQNLKSPITRGLTPGKLSLKSACALAVTHHPSLATYPMDRRAADARILKASRIPNPVLNLDDEDFFGTGDLGGLSASVLNSLLTQVIERGGKRQARTEAARQAGKVMEAEYEVRRREVMTETGRLYLEAVAARENVLFYKAALERSQETARLVSLLLDSGRVTISSSQQANLEVQKNQLVLDEALKKSERASQALSAQWGDPRTTAVDHLKLAPPPVTLDSKSAQSAGLSGHPKIIHMQARVSESNSLVALAKANRLSNVTLGGGIRHASASDELSGLASLSIPLRVFDKKEDAIREMTALAEKSRTELAATKRLLNDKFILAWSELESAHRSARLIQTDLLPSALTVFQSAENAFRAGKITALEYLAAQQQFAQIRTQWLEARRNYHLRALSVQSLTHRSL